MKYFLKAVQNYAVFSGRSIRSEYWFFVLFYYIIFILTAILDRAIGTTITVNSFNEPQTLPYGYICLLFIVSMIIPSLAVTVRRLHDVNKSGWFILISLIPIVGTIWLIVLMATDSDPNENKWGPNPKALPVAGF